MSASSNNGKIDIPDEGFAEVTLAGRTNRVDVWAAWWRLHGAWEEGLEELEYLRRLRQVLTELGFDASEEKLSGIAVRAFCKAMGDRIEALKKSEPEAPPGDSPSSPTSTAPESTA